MVPLLFHTLVAVTGFWCIIYIIDKIASQYILRGWQERSGCYTSFAYIRCYTTKLNQVFKVWSGCNRRLVRGWFNLGVVTGLALMLISVMVLFYSLYQGIFGSSKSERVLTPVMPGVNLPWNQLIHYFITLVICGVFHELGHALAAVTEQVRINGFGLFLMFLYPGAFVDLHPDHLAVISPLRQLRIYCAGIWHNIILTLSVAVLFFSLPYLSLPFYTTGQGAVVTSVAPSSALQDKLWPGVTITSIDSCAIHNRKNWFGCLSDIMVHSQRGYCVDKDEIKHRTFHFINETIENLDGGRECCTPDSQSDLCFVSKGHTSDLDKYICLTARRIVSDITCHTHDECAAINPGYTCLTPSLGYELHLVKIGHTGPGDPILFTGDIGRLQYSVTTTDYQSTYWPIWVPDLLETMCLYIGSISAALALMNILPAYALDGQWTLGAILEYWLPEHPWRNRIFNGVLMIVTSLLILNIVMAFCILISW